MKLPTADTRQHYAWGFLQPRQKTFCTATPALHKPVPQLRQIFIKNITPKFHFGRQLSSGGGFRSVDNYPESHGLDSMKMLAEYLEKAIAFERMAADEKDARLKADLETQAVAYRKLAVQRAKQYKLDLQQQSN